MISNDKRDSVLFKLIECGLEAYLVDHGQYLDNGIHEKIRISPITPYRRANVLSNGLDPGSNKKISPEELKITVAALLENPDLHISVKDLIIHNMDLFV
jgi:hypothetical protein